MRSFVPLLSSLLLLVLLAAPATAQPVIRLDLAPTASRVAERLSLDIPELERRLEREVGALYGLADVGEFLRLSANAQALVGAGIGADYASSPTGFFFGFGVNAAVDAGDADLRDPDFEFDRAVPVSAGAMLSVMAGYNFTQQGVPWLTLSAHGLHVPMNVNQLEAEFTNLGLFAQVKLLRQTKEGFRALHWGGIDLTTGFTYARTTYELDESLLIENGDGFRASTSLGSGVTLDTLSQGNLRLEQTGLTIPLEVTTSLTLFELLSIYGGAGIDIPFGDAKSTLGLDTALSARIDGEQLELGTARLDVNERARADDLLPRVMLGVQANLWKLRVFAQVAVSTRDTAVGVATGIRMVL